VKRRTKTGIAARPDIDYELADNREKDIHTQQHIPSLDAITGQAWPVRTAPAHRRGGHRSRISQHRLR
jgi:hypothetical protein